MDKCPQDKCCLDKCCDDSCNLLYMFPGSFVSSLIEIGPVTAEILLSKSLCGGGGGRWWEEVVVGVLTYFSVQLKPRPS